MTNCQPTKMIYYDQAQIPIINIAENYQIQLWPIIFIALYPINGQIEKQNAITKVYLCTFINLEQNILAANFLSWIASYPLCVLKAFDHMFLNIIAEVESKKGKYKHINTKT